MKPARQADVKFILVPTADRGLKFSEGVWLDVHRKYWAHEQSTIYSAVPLF